MPLFAEAVSEKVPVAGRALCQFLEANAEAIVGGKPIELPWRLVLHILPGLIALGDRAVARWSRPPLA